LVEAVSLHDQQSDNFCKIQKKNTEWTGSVIYVGRFIALLSSRTPCVWVLHCCEGKGGVSIVGSLPVESVHLAHPHQLCQRHWTKLNCCTRDNWLFGSKVEVVTTLAHFQNLPQLNWHCLILALCHYQCRQSVQIFRRAAATLGSCLVDSLCHHSHQLSNDYWEEKQALYATLDLNSAWSLRNERQYCWALNGALQRKGWQIKFCLL
jgi:hypothetical protein